MKGPLPIVYSPVDECGFSFHIRNLAKQEGRKISMNRIARLWWIARNSPYLSVRRKEKHLLDETDIIRQANGLTITDKALKEDIIFLRKAGILIDVITSDSVLLNAEYKKRISSILQQ